MYSCIHHQPWQCHLFCTYILSNLQGLHSDTPEHRLLWISFSRQAREVCSVLVATRPLTVAALYVELQAVMFTPVFMLFLRTGTQDTRYFEIFQSSFSSMRKKETLLMHLHIGLSTDTVVYWNVTCHLFVFSVGFPFPFRTCFRNAHCDECQICCVARYATSQERTHLMSWHYIMILGQTSLFD